MQNSSNITKQNRNIAIHLIVAFCLPVLLYLQTLGFGFTDYDDNAIINNNYSFLSDPGNSAKAFLNDAFLLRNQPSQTPSYVGDIFYRPLQTISYMSDIWISGGNNIWMYHFSNVLLLGLISCLLFLFLRKFNIPPVPALLFTLIYCSHPLFVSTVAWIPARGDLLLMVFSLISFLFFIIFLKTPRLIYLVTSWFAFSIALFCKETAALLPFIFIVYYLFFSLKKDTVANKNSAMNFLAVALCLISGVFWYWLRSISTGNLLHANNVGLVSFIKNLRTIPESLAMFFMPFKIAPVPAYSLFNTLTGLVLIMIILMIVFRNKEFRKEKIFGLLWFLFLLVPTMFYKNEYVDYLNHRFFLPFTGILLFTIFSLPKKWFEFKNVWSLIIVVIILSSVTFMKARSYSDPMAFYNSVIAHNQGNALMYNNRGYEFEIRENFQGAIDDYSKAIELKPDFELAFYNRGNVFGAVGNLDGAIQDYNNAILLNPQNANALINRGNAFYNKGDLKQAVKDYDIVLDLNPGNLLAYVNRGTAYNNMGEYESAINDFTRVIALNPYLAIAYYNRGTAYKANGMLVEAEKDFMIFEKLTKR